MLARFLLGAVLIGAVPAEANDRRDCYTQASSLEAAAECINKIAKNGHVGASLILPYPAPVSSGVGDYCLNISSFLDGVGSAVCFKVVGPGYQLYCSYDRLVAHLLKTEVCAP